MVVPLLPCSLSFIQGSDLSFKGLPEEAFEHLTSLNYLYLANNKVRAIEGGCVDFPGVGGLPWSGRASLEWAGFSGVGGLP